MTSLQFPSNAVETLERAYDGQVDSEEGDEWLVYIIDSAPKDAQAVCHEAMSAYSDEIGFLKPANQSSEGFHPQTLQDCLNRHFAMIERRLPEAVSNAEDDTAFYIFGFIALTLPDWREQGLAAVHCDKDRGKWKVTHCTNIPVSELGMELTSVSNVDDSFDRTLERYHDGSGNDGPDNQGGAVPVDQWQWLVLCSGTSRGAAERVILDPRGDATYPLGEGCLWYMPDVVEVEALKEAFVMGYAKVLGNPYVPANPTVRVVCRRHPELFVHVDSANLTEQGVEIVSMKWDGNIKRSEEELEEVGRRAKAVVRRCNVNEVVPTLEQMAGGQI